MVAGTMLYEESRSDGLSMDVSFDDDPVVIFNIAVSDNKCNLEIGRAS
jgi:hypothetical protein